jgi:peptidoglycan/LPS O-acetylase OafA/YrhL
MTKIKNRPEIDGLRAIAIITVVLYHTALGINGGYIGVDVFFVISGYLITSLILNDLSSGTFRLLDFWERRVRRILPALALVVAACIAAAWVIFFPGDFKEFGRSVTYQSLFLSNVFFRRSTGYFSSDDTQPLLHTWSLAIEEQFYILFPLVLITVAKFANRRVAVVLAALAFGSFAVSVYATRFHPIAAFYLLPTRAWELLLGALLAAASGLKPPSKWINECLSWVGLLGILYAAFFYTKDTPFPGLAALPPSLGAALVIWTNSSSLTSVGKILSLRVLVFVGLISYSLYLWHWPLLVFTKYWAFTQPSRTTSLAVVAASLLLATITWKVVETPFRKRAVFPRRIQVFTFAGTTLVALLLVGGTINHANGFQSRWSPAALKFLEGQNDQDFRVELTRASVENGNLTAIGYKQADRPIDLLIWGDSHGMAVLHVLDVVCAEHGVRAVAATHSATIPLLDFPCNSTYSLKGDTVPYNQAILAYVTEQKIKNVLLVAAWNGYISPPNDYSGPPIPAELDNFKSSLAKTIHALHQAGAKVLILKDVPKQKFNVPRALATATRVGEDPARVGLPIGEHEARTSSVNKLFDEYAGPSVVVLDPVNIFTDSTGLCRAELDGRPLYFDQHHLSIFGEMQLQPMFESLFGSGALVRNATLDQNAPGR